MHRAYQTALKLFSPDAVFILGMNKKKCLNKSNFTDFLMKVERSDLKHSPVLLAYEKNMRI